MDFDELQVFAGKAKKVFEHTTDKLIDEVLDRLGDDFKVVTSVGDVQIIVSDEGTGVGNRRRRMLSSNDLNQSSLNNNVITTMGDIRSYLKRNLQETPTGLRVFVDVFVDVRSGTTYKPSVLINEIKSALDENSERDAFILSLQTADVTFAPINVMKKFTINDEEIALVRAPNTTRWIYIGPGIGVGVLAIAFVIVFVSCRRGRGRDDVFYPDENDEVEFREPTPPFDPRDPRADHRINR